MGRRDEVETKLLRLRHWLQSHQLDAVLITSQSNFAWITGGGNNFVSTADTGGTASVLVNGDGAYLLSNNIEMPRLMEEEVSGLPFEEAQWLWYESGEARNHLARMCDMSKTVSDISFLSLPLVPGDFSNLRYTMLPQEIERYQQLGLEAAQAVEAACGDAEPGRTEREVAASLAFHCHKLGILPVVNLVGSDHRISNFRHPLPTNKLIERSLMVVLTGRRHGLHVSLTRLVSFAPLDADLAARHRAVAAVDARFILESRAGSRLGQIVGRAILQYAKEGYPQEWQLHHQGGLTGYAGREILATSDTDHPLGHNQVVAWNPSITGTKSEDTVLLTPDGPKVLTRTGDWPEIEVELREGAISRPAIKSPS